MSNINTYDKFIKNTINEINESKSNTDISKSFIDYYLNRDNEGIIFNNIKYRRELDVSILEFLAMLNDNRLKIKIIDSNDMKYDMDNDISIKISINTTMFFLSNSYNENQNIFDYFNTNNSLYTDSYVDEKFNQYIKKITKKFINLRDERDITTTKFVNESIFYINNEDNIIINELYTDSNKSISFINNLNINSDISEFMLHTKNSKIGIECVMTMSILDIIKLKEKFNFYKDIYFYILDPLESLMRYGYIDETQLCMPKISEMIKNDFKDKKYTNALLKLQTNHILRFKLICDDIWLLIENIKNINSSNIETIVTKLNKLSFLKN